MPPWNRYLWETTKDGYEYFFSTLGLLETELGAKKAKLARFHPEKCQPRRQTHPSYNNFTGKQTVLLQIRFHTPAFSYGWFYKGFRHNPGFSYRLPGAAVSWKDPVMADMPHLSLDSIRSRQIFHVPVYRSITCGTFATFLYKCREFVAHMPQSYLAEVLFVAHTPQILTEHGDLWHICHFFIQRTLIPSDNIRNPVPISGHNTGAKQEHRHGRRLPYRGTDTR